ncbi:helix-turn-helix domain-containing protein [Paenibacillus sp. 1P07SE]|uniref:helix-turn-helix domain-containing protein n=1 Tax=Paenibacillus sp. 1P07SE TaxID=3132209 RepID=UPI0039A6D7B8
MYKLMIRFFVPYIIIMIITHAISMYSNYNTFVAMKEEVVAVNVQALEQTKEILDRRFAEIDLIAKQLTNNPRVYNYQTVTEPFQGRSTYRTVEIVKELYDYKQSNNFIFDYYLYYHASDMVISADTSYRLPAFLDTIYGYVGRDAEAWRSYLKSQFFHQHILPSEPLTIRGREQAMLTYVHSIGLPHSSQGEVVVLIDERQVRQLLEGLVQDSTGRAYIADKQGQILVDTGTRGPDGTTRAAPAAISTPGPRQGVFEKSVDGDAMTVVYTTSSHNNWQYVVAQPTGTVMDSVTAAQRTTLTALAISFLIGACIALYMAYRNSLPLQTILKRVMDGLEGEVSKGKDAYALIEEKIRQLTLGKAQLEQRMTDQLPMLRHTSIGQLLKGEFSSEDEIRRLLRHAGLPLARGHYCVCVLHLHLYHEEEGVQPALKQLDKARIIAREVLLSVTRDTDFLYDIDEDKIALLYACPDGVEADCREELTALMTPVKELLEQRLPMRCLLAAGSVSGALAEISRSYEEARQALAAGYLQESTETILWHEDLPQGLHSYSYPADVEGRLANLIKAGNESEMLGLLRELYEENFVHRQLTQPMLQLFLYDLIGTVMKLSELLEQYEDDTREAYAEALLLQLDEYADLGAVYHMVQEACLQLCRIQHDRKRSRNVGLRDEVVAFVDASFTDPDLSLALVADRFKMSEVYLSQFFKEQTGANFSDHLEQLRMERARELLLQSELTVHEIAQQAGYNTANSFGRAFKRIHGMSATSYKKSQSGLE